jgi:anti-anti-sigma factor
MPGSLTLTPQSKSASLTLSGRFDAHLASEMSKWTATLRQAQVAHLIVDLSAVRFIDNAALQWLQTERQQLRALYGNLWVRSPGPTVRAILELSGYIVESSILDSSELAA